MFQLSSDFIDEQKLRQLLQNPLAGALVVFEGWVRNHNEEKVVTLLEYEAYQDLAVTEAQKILLEAKEKFHFFQAICVHRVGKLNIGDTAVWVGVNSAHRDDAFLAARYIIDEIKMRLPIWKKEYYENGDSGWVNCEACAHKH